MGAEIATIRETLSAWESAIYTLGADFGGIAAAPAEAAAPAAAADGDGGDGDGGGGRIFLEDPTPINPRRDNISRKDNPSLRYIYIYIYIYTHHIFI